MVLTTYYSLLYKYILVRKTSHFHALHGGNRRGSLLHFQGFSVCVLVLMSSCFDIYHFRSQHIRILRSPRSCCFSTHPGDRYVANIIPSPAAFLRIRRPPAGRECCHTHSNLITPILANQHILATTVFVNILPSPAALQRLRRPSMRRGCFKLMLLLT